MSTPWKPGRPFSRPSPAVECFHQDSPFKPVAVRTVQGKIFEWTQTGFFERGFWIDIDDNTRVAQVTGIPLSRTYPEDV